ncbi:uncharacterized protein B0I36DRAFT_351162 [Microdochium trichocladiopsis]|uniref:Regulator of Ty1 transposition protein 10 n=1 Tax=Microdochium trichocladiopsis TaxID=1682393 RepID=A0A9P9BNF0_9PEZI|nr:uncharacterized protein B0I36DRAFT_351162 [Microdochium trichocladiopsis]KAH7027656.1 hypothetical protein B0I36DRAFT_351162 [Microdochium trichocladiopsis]
MAPIIPAGHDCGHSGAREERHSQGASPAGAMTTREYPLARRCGLRREHVHAPITALAFYTPAASASDSARGASRARRYLLAAEDTDLQIYDVSASSDEDSLPTVGSNLSGDEAIREESAAPGGTAHEQRLLKQIPIFRAQSVHGISIRYQTRGEKADDDRILIWGGYSVAVLSAKALFEGIVETTKGDEDDICSRGRSVEYIAEFRAPDWIFDAKISPSDRDRVVMLTAHNEIVEARVTRSVATSAAGGRDGLALEMVSVRSPSRPILYAGNLLWLGTDCVLVAAGTVFGEVVVWKWHAQRPERAPSPPSEHEVWCEHLFAFSGHEGSIFGIQISPELVVPGSERPVRLLATCSDDRTVRVWDITESQIQESAADLKPRDVSVSLPEARETGFGPNGNTTTKQDEPTGGGGKSTQLEADSARRCVAIAMGHISRIWHVKFAEPRPGSSNVFPINSFGEDATAQKWHLSFGPQQQTATASRNASAKTRISTLGEAALTHQAIYRNHTGKHIWSRAVLSHLDDSVTIATGGSDGKIALVRDKDEAMSVDGQGSWEKTYSLESLAKISGAEPLPEPKPPIVETVVSTQDSGEEKPKKKVKPPKPPKESFQRYTFISEDKLLVITNQGRCFVGTIQGQEIEWKALAIPEGMRTSLTGYSVVESSLVTSTAYIGTSRGEVFALSDEDNATPRLVTTVPGKIADLFCLSDEQRQGEQPSYGHDTKLMITVLGAATAAIVSISGRCAVTATVAVELEKGFVTTAASLADDTLILGSRNGAISIFSRNEATSPYTVAQTLSARLTDAITSIVLLPRQTGSIANYFLATCRDGKYRIYQRRIPTNAKKSQEAIVLLQETSPPFGPLIEQAWFTNNASTNTIELMLCGFRSTNAVLWNATQQREVATVDCGGAHRSFAMTLLQRKNRKQQQQQQRQGSPDGFRFVFTKASEMHIFSQGRSQAQTIKPGSHGREIRAVSSSGQYTATAAEDTVIRIHKYTPPSPSGFRSQTSGGGSFRCVATIEKHATGIQALRWHENEYLFSSGGNEEFFVWKANQVESDVCPLGVACEAVFRDKSEIGDLRIMDFDVEPMMDDDGGADNGGEGMQFCITMALSNSTVQSYLYSSAGGFRLLGRRHYTGACLMQLRHLGFSSSSTDDHIRRQPHVLTASTDGHLAVFVGVQPDLGIEPVTPETMDGASPQASRARHAAADKTSLIARLHQSGIKSLDMLRLPTSSPCASSSYLVVTGGDDNALGVMHLSYTASTAKYKVQGKFIVRSAHAAAVTGIGIVRLENGGRDAVVASTSNDQRVKTWRVVGWQEPEATRVLLVGDEYSGVADSGDLEIISRGGLGGDGDDGEAFTAGSFIVGGVGMEVWRV